MGRSARIALVLGALACGSAPQQVNETAVTYRAGFTSEEGVNTKVIFPFPADSAELTVQQGIAVTEGGVARVESTAEGVGLAVEGRGKVEASFRATKLKGLGEGEGIPESALSRPAADGGVGDRTLQVNKGGAASVAVDFEYTASRDCGQRCGGKRSWTYRGLVGLSLQEVAMTFSEEKKQ